MRRGSMRWALGAARKDGGGLMLNGAVTGVTCCTGFWSTPRARPWRALRRKLRFLPAPPVPSPSSPPSTP